jgi:hypothetical protein
VLGQVLHNLPWRPKHIVKLDRVDFKRCVVNRHDGNSEPLHDLFNVFIVQSDWDEGALKLHWQNPKFLEEQLSGTSGNVISDPVWHQGVSFTEDYVLLLCLYGSGKAVIDPPNALYQVALDMQFGFL